MIYIGIDAGKNGGIAVQNDNGVFVYKMPETVSGLNDLLQILKGDGDCIIALEKLNLHASDQRERGKVLRMQVLMRNFEQIHTVLELLDCPYLLVHPAAWQSKLGLRIKGEEKEERKRRYKEIAGALYPQIKTTLWNADALLIMQFAKWATTVGIKWLKKCKDGKGIERFWQEL